jgi:hypothetical protein
MELTLNRVTRTDTSTIGELSIDGGERECYILEDRDRRLTQDTPIAVIKTNKVFGKTCIPSGRYEVVVTFSARFKKPLPLLMNVPGFDGIRIHPGNTAENTLGCLLPGSTKDKDFVGGSKVAFEKLFSKIKAAAETEKIFITIK